MTSKDDWVNDLDPIQPADWDRLIKMGVDGIISDYPDLLN